MVRHFGDGSLLSWGAVVLCNKMFYYISPREMAQSFLKMNTRRKKNSLGEIIGIAHFKKSLSLEDVLHSSKGLISKEICGILPFYGNTD